MSSEIVRATGAGRPRDSALDTAILDAVERLIGEHGFDATSIETVAAAAGVSRATVYRRWPGKTELVIAAVRRRHRDPLTPVDTGSLRSDLFALFAEDIARLSADGQLVAGVVTAMRSRPELWTAITDIVIADFQHRFATVAQRAARRGEIRDDADLDLLLDVIRSTMIGHLVFRRDPMEPEFVQRLIDHLMLPLLLRHP